MSTIHDVRRTRLRELIAELDPPTQAEFSRKFRVSPKQTSAWLRAPGKNGAKNMNDTTSRNIEKAFGKPRGWLDGSLTAVTSPAPMPSQPSQPAGLDVATMAEAEGMVRTAERMRGRAMPQDGRGYWLARFYFLISAEPSGLPDALKLAGEAGSGKAEDAGTGR